MVAMVKLGHGEVSKCCLNYHFNYTVQETTTLLVACSQVAQADPTKSCPRLDSDEPGKTQIVSTSMHSLLATYS